MGRNHLQSYLQGNCDGKRSHSRGREMHILPGGRNVDFPIRVVVDGSRVDCDTDHHLQFRDILVFGNGRGTLQKRVVCL
jgi:hypothetical protein